MTIPTPLHLQISVPFSGTLVITPEVVQKLFGIQTDSPQTDRSQPIDKFCEHPERHGRLSRQCRRRHDTHLFLLLIAVEAGVFQPQPRRNAEPCSLAFLLFNERTPMTAIAAQRKPERITSFKAQPAVQASIDFFLPDQRFVF